VSSVFLHVPWGFWPRQAASDDAILCCFLRRGIRLDELTSRMSQVRPLFRPLGIKPFRGFTARSKGSTRSFSTLDPAQMAGAGAGGLAANTPFVIPRKRSACRHPGRLAGFWREPHVLSKPRRRGQFSPRWR
jgi:hypothetical protein